MWLVNRHIIQNWCGTKGLYNASYYLIIGVGFEKKYCTTNSLPNKSLAQKEIVMIRTSTITIISKLSLEGND